MHASPEFDLHLVQLRLQPLANRLPQHRKLSIAPFFPQICVKPRKWNVSGFPSPRCFRFLTANGPKRIGLSPSRDTDCWQLRERLASEFQFKSLK